jgi:pimeloyl-ACP methyl ester carboxylesterase
MDIGVSDQLVFRARTAGSPEAPPVLLLHGFPQTSRCWAHQLEALADAGRYAVAFDQRGYSPGARPTEVEAYEPAALVSDVLAVAEALGFERFDLVGHDLGGAVAWMVAGQAPEQVTTLTVASTPHPAAFRASYQRADSDQSERSGYMRSFRQAERGTIEAGMLADDAHRLRQLYAGLEPAAVEEYLTVLRQPGALPAALDWYRAMSARVSAATPATSVPTLYVWSDADPSLGREAAEATAECVTGPYRFEVLAGVGHWIPELAAETFTPMLIDHLTQPPGRRP